MDHLRNFLVHFHSHEPNENHKNANERKNCCKSEKKKFQIFQIFFKIFFHFYFNFLSCGCCCCNSGDSRAFAQITITNFITHKVKSTRNVTIAIFIVVTEFFGNFWIANFTANSRRKNSMMRRTIYGCT